MNCNGCADYKSLTAKELRPSNRPPQGTPGVLSDASPILGCSEDHAQGLFIGNELDPATRKPRGRLELDPTDLLTHGLIVGMTGSGKTGLAIALIEEVAAAGRPRARHRPQGRPRQPAPPVRPTWPRPRSSPGSIPRRRAGEGKTAEQAGGRGGRAAGRRAWPSGASARPTSPISRAAPRGGDLHAGLARGRAPERAAVARGADGALRRARGGPARRDRGHRGRPARPRADRRRSPAVARSRSCSPT